MPKVQDSAIFSHPKKLFQKANTKAEVEIFKPREFKYGTERISFTDIYKSQARSIEPEQLEKNNNNWIKEIYLNKHFYKEYIDCLKTDGFTEIEAKNILDQTIYHFNRAKSSATAQESLGKIASHATTVNIILCLAKHLLDSNPAPRLLHTVINLTYGFTKSIRSYFQYSIYNRPDDDAAMNRYQADVYGNEVSGKLATASTFTEIKINSWAYTLAELLPEEYGTPVKKILSLPTSLWWRGRMPAHINQQFFTDLLKWMFHFIPSKLGVKKSIGVINKINEKENIKPDYVMERHYKNVGLTDKKDQKPIKFFSQLFKLVKNTFSRDINIQRNSSKKLAETIAPILGMYGFFASAIGNGIGSILKLFKTESEFFDAVNSTSFTSQQMIYLPKIIMPMYTETKELEYVLRKQETRNHYKKEEIKKLKDFCKEKKMLSYLGFSCLPLSIINTALKLIKIENYFPLKIKAITDDLVIAVSNKFFSHRRHLIGKQFRLENPEFYYEGIKA
ncbi:MAG: hypothetical protein HY094_06570 [Candidatus Melainabacteria bacterium]|nr:hypothetical protein [Candidatus Melainabacteria bacterium]